jgi:hypothetical protein
MKKLLVLPFLLLFFSCEEEGKFTQNLVEDTPISPVAQLLYTGNFEPTSGINVSGEARILSENNNYKLELSNFSISDGPDLKVYLSKSSSPNDFVTLGNLTSARIYAIPQNIDFEQYNHVLIHCQQYNHLFAIAALNPN